MVLYPIYVGSLSLDSTVADFKEMRMYLFGSVQDLAAGFCEHDNEYANYC
jgi:hypothetical protein